MRADQLSGPLWVFGWLGVVAASGGVPSQVHCTGVGCVDGVAPLGGTAPAPVAAAAPQTSSNVVRSAMVFNSTEPASLYHGYRIPSAVVAENGDLLVFAEGRAPKRRPDARGNETVCWGQPASLYDWKCYAKDVVLRRSGDKGHTFGAIRTLAACNATAFYTNPLGLVDRIRGTIWLAYVRCPIPATINPSVSAFVNCTQLLRSSLDHGVTWSPEMVVDGTTPQHDGGVGAGLQLASGRLLFPRNGAGSMISDDGGESWRLGSKLQHGGESQAVQLANTSVLMQMRAVATYAYIWLRSDDGGETFGPPLLHTTPFVPDCPTSVLLDEHGRLLLSHPNPTNHTLPRPLGRRNLTISIGAFNAGGTAVWHDAVVVFAGPSGYSSLASVTKWDLDIVGAVGVVYEMSTDGKEPLDFEGVQLAIISMPA